MAITINEDGSQRKRKKGEPFNVSQWIGPRPDTHLPSDGPGSLLDRRDTDMIEWERWKHGGSKGYPSDREYPSGTFPLAKNKKKKKSRKA